VAEREHMSDVDTFDGGSVRRGRGEADEKGKREVSQEREGDLLTIHPEVDGRLKDIARA
jgi:5'-nucleotidase